MTDTIQVPLDNRLIQRGLTPPSIRMLPAEATVVSWAFDVLYVAILQRPEEVSPEIAHRTLARSGRRAFLRLEGTTPGQ